MATTSNVKMAVTPREEVQTRLDALLHHGNAPLALALADLDNFKEINDAHGSGAGDRVLLAWERTLRGSVPKDAVVARLGGDEYAVAFPGLSPENALIVCEEIRSHFASHEVEGVDQPLNASIGVVAAPTHGTTGADLLRTAGEALMRGKREGRGRTAMYVEEKMVLKTTYYSRASLDRLAKLAANTGRTEAALLREALENVLDNYRDEL